LQLHRLSPEIEKQFEGSASFEIHASDEDVGRYLDNHMSQLPSFILRNVDLQAEIKKEIIKTVDGMDESSHTVLVYQAS
jgi:hypothetical protein